jgi:hypothetical protein
MTRKDRTLDALVLNNQSIHGSTSFSLSHVHCIDKDDRKETKSVDAVVTLSGDPTSKRACWATKTLNTIGKEDIIHTM